MHDEEGFELQREGLTQNLYEFGLPCRKPGLAGPYPAAGPDQRKLRQIAIDLQRGAHTVQNWKTLAHGADELRLSVETDHPVTGQIVGAFRNTVSLKITGMREESDRDGADPPDDCLLYTSPSPRD